MHTCILSISSQPRRPGGGGKDAASQYKEGTQHRHGRHQSDGKDARKHRQGCRRSISYTALQEQAAMNRPQRFRGLATDPSVQRKAPEAVFRQAGIVVGKTSREEPYRASSADSSRDALLKSLGSRAFWNAHRYTEVSKPRHCAGIAQPGGMT